MIYLLRRISLNKEILQILQYLQNKLQLLNYGYLQQVATMRLSLTISAEDNEKTVKYILKNKLNLSERMVKKLKFSGRILLDSAPVHVNVPVHTGNLLEALVDMEEVNEAILPEPIDLDIIYEDDMLLAVNKPPNMVVHPTFRHFTGTAANALMYHLLQKNVKTLVRPVSRLDRDTSGIIIFALNPFIQESLIRQMHDNTFIKEYAGIVHGTFDEPVGTINLPIDRLPNSIMLRHVTEGGAPSVTHFEVLEQFNDTAFLKFKLETGRTHQIRVHSQASGHPIFGDTLYSLPNYVSIHQGLISRQALHSRRTVFRHPFTNLFLELEAPLPSDMLRTLEILRK
jgi:23S rRNA pseudouridine1911/1915/1917 synthase